jgi:predicted DNA binding protein
MAVIAELTVPADAFPLGELLTANPDLYIDFEKVVPVDNNVLPLFWVYGDGISIFEKRVTENEHVLDLQMVEQTADRTLYAIEWVVSPGTFFDGLVETNATILDAKGHGSQDWRFRLLFSSHEHLSEFHTISQDKSISIDVDRIYAVQDMGASLDTATLSQKQREALELAVTRGYFDTPRGITLEELAAEFDISTQALSDRLRRATKTIVEQAVRFSGEYS